MPTPTFESRRREVTDYFNATAVEAWKKLTSDDKVSGIRETVRQGRQEMRDTLLDWLGDLSDQRLLDAGCGTGALAVEAARRGARVVAVDVAGNLIDQARQRTPEDVAPEALDFRVGDYADPTLGSFDCVVAMDSLIHYRGEDMVTVLSGLARRTARAMVFTFAPRTPLLATMHVVGKVFPRTDRSPAIEPIGEARLKEMLAADPVLAEWRVGRTRRITRGFYISQALELVRP